AEKARAGEGPTLVECVTYRVLGHTTSDDPSRYRDEREVEPWRARDPIALFERRLGLGRAEIEDAGAWARALVERAIAEAEHAPPPAPETMIEDVCASVPATLREDLARALRTYQKG